MVPTETRSTREQLAIGTGCHVLDEVVDRRPAALELLVIALVLLAALSGCARRGRHSAPPPPAPIPYVVAPLQAPAHAIDATLGHATTIAIGATSLSVFGLVFVLIEAAAFTRLAVAVAVSCVATTIGLIGLRLAVPLVAAIMPWFVFAAVISGLVAAVMWYRHNGPVRLKVPALLKRKPKLPTPPAP